MTGMSTRSSPVPTGSRQAAALRLGPNLAFAALTVGTVLLAITGGALQILIAPLASSFVFAFGLAARDPDIVLLAWLDQGTNLTLLEAESAAGSVVVVIISVVAVLVLADIAQMTMHSSPFGGVQAARQFRSQVPRLAIVGLASCLFAFAGLAFAPVVALRPYPELAIAVLAVAALAAIAVVGSADR